MNLLVDIGNSRIKWALQQNNNSLNSFALAHHQKDFIAQLTEKWQMLQKPSILALSCVACELVKQDVIALATQLWGDIKIIIAQSTSYDYGVQNSYQQPHKLGIDRWLCLIAAHHDYQHAVWIIDCGTAITIDFLDENGRHGGGVIAPGLRLMKSALLHNTAALTMVEEEHVAGLANQTDKAIFSGVIYAATGLIKQALKSRNSKAVLVLTGGDAELIARHLSDSVIIEPDLVLKGLAILVHKYL